MAYLNFQAKEGMGSVDQAKDEAWYSFVDRMRKWSSYRTSRHYGLPPHYRVELKQFVVKHKCENKDDDGLG